MSKYNVGSVKKSILSNLNEQTAVKGFVAVLKESELLKTVHEIYSNLEHKFIKNEGLAIKYIDENINVWTAKGYTIEALEAENKKFIPLMEGIELSGSRAKLYSNINTLLCESIKGAKTNVNKLHDSFTAVLEHITTNEPISEIENVDEIPASLEETIALYNEKYAHLNEDEILVLNSMVEGYASAHSKSDAFILLKESTIGALLAYKESTLTEAVGGNIEEAQEHTSRIDTAIGNIEKLQFNESTYLDDVADLIDLKNGLGD